MNARQGKTLFGAICAFIATLVVIQLWLVAAALEALYDNETGVLLPALVASVVLFCVNARLLKLVVDFDARLRQARREAGERA